MDQLISDGSALFSCVGFLCVHGRGGETREE